MAKKSAQYALFVLFIFACSTGITKKNAPAKRVGPSEEIDSYVGKMMKVHEIPGMALAVVGKKGIIHKGFYGKASLESGKSITNKTVFKIFSLTKTMVATGIFKLIEEGKISLDDELSDYFVAMPKDWQSVTIANLLSHSSGLPDVRKYMREFEDNEIDSEIFVSLLYNDEMDFITNTEWSYNQTNYILLRLIIEKVSKTSFEDYILKHQFPNADSTAVFFSSGPTKDRLNGAKYYDFDTESSSFRKKSEFSGKKNLPLAGMNITLDQYVSWNNRLDRSELIAQPTKKAMWSAFDFTETDRRFLHGWDVYEVNGHDSFGFSGGGVSGFRKFLDKDLSIIVLTTGFRYYPAHDIIIDHIAGVVDKRFEDKDSALKEEIMSKYFLTDTVKSLQDMVREVKSIRPNMNLEAVFKSVGYELYFSLGRKQEAIQLFELNVLEYPNSYDTYGSLAYLQFLTGQFELSRMNYVKALELNPENGYSERRIKEIDQMKK